MRRFRYLEFLSGVLFVSATWAGPASIEPMKNARNLITKGDCLGAIAAFDKIYWTDARNSNDALFYIIYCQDRLKFLGAAQKNILYLNTRVLPPSHQKLIQHIKEKRIVLPEVKTSFWSLGGNFGGLSYSNSTLYRSGLFWGFSGAWADFNQRVVFSLDQLKLVRNGLTDFNQSQFLASYGRSFSDRFGAKLTSIYLSNNDLDTNGAIVVGGSMKYYYALGAYIGPEFYFSSYSAYTPRSLQVFQGSLNGGWLIASSPQTGFYLDWKLIAIRPQSADNSLGVFNQNYLSAEMYLRLLTLQSQWVLGGWAGKQIFGVQNEGGMVANVALERRWGAKASFGHALSGNVQLGVFVGTESIVETPVSQSFSGGATMGILW